MAQLVQHQTRPMAGPAAAVALAALVLGGIVGGAAAINLPSLVQPAAAAVTVAGQGGIVRSWQPTVQQRGTDSSIPNTPYVNRPAWGGK